MTDTGASIIVKFSDELQRHMNRNNGSLLIFTYSVVMGSYFEVAYHWDTLDDECSAKQCRIFGEINESLEVVLSRLQIELVNAGVVNAVSNDESKYIRYYSRDGSSDERKCRNCGQPKGLHAAVSPLNDEHWCPNPHGRGFIENRDDIASCIFWP